MPQYEVRIKDSLGNDLFTMAQRGHIISALATYRFYKEREQVGKTIFGPEGLPPGMDVAAVSIVKLEYAKTTVLIRHPYSTPLTADEAAAAKELESKIEEMES